MSTPTASGGESDCPVCGAAYAGYRFCLNCGHRYQGQVTQSPGPRYAASDPAPDSPVETGDVETGDVETGDVETGDPEAGDAETGEVPLPGLGERRAERPQAAASPKETSPAAPLPARSGSDRPTSNLSWRNLPQISLPQLPRPSLAMPQIPKLIRPNAAAGPDDAPVGGRSARTMLALLVGIVIVLLLVAVGLVLSLGGDDSGKPKKSATSGEASADPGFTLSCWDGQRVRRVSACAPLTGDKAMAWVFPSLDRRLCERRTPPARAVTAWSCRLRSDAGVSRVTYVEFDTRRDMVAWTRDTVGTQGRKGVRRVLVRSERDDPERWVWRERKPGRDGRWTTVSTYVGERWAARVTATSKQARNDGFATVEFRPLRWLHGVPDDDRPED